MLKEFMESVQDFGNYGIISTLIFVVWFVFITYHIIKINKVEEQEYSRIPFDDDIENKEN